MLFVYKGNRSKITYSFPFWLSDHCHIRRHGHYMETDDIDNGCGWLYFQMTVEAVNSRMGSSRLWIRIDGIRRDFAESSKRKHFGKLITFSFLWIINASIYQFIYCSRVSLPKIIKLCRLIELVNLWSPMCFQQIS